MEYSALRWKRQKRTPEIFPFGGIPHTRVAILCMEIEHLSGKEAIELVRAHQK